MNGSRRSPGSGKKPNLNAAFLVDIEVLLWRHRVGTGASVSEIRREQTYSAN